MIFGTCGGSPVETWRLMMYFWISAPAIPDRMATITSGLYSLILLKITSTWSVSKYESQNSTFTSGMA